MKQQTIVLSETNKNKVVTAFQSAFGTKAYLRTRYILLDSIEEVEELLKTRLNLGPELNPSNKLIASKQDTCPATTGCTDEKDSLISVGITERLHDGDEITIRKNDIIIRLAQPKSIYDDVAKFMVISWP